MADKRGSETHHLTDDLNDMVERHTSGASMVIALVLMVLVLAGAFLVFHLTQRNTHAVTTITASESAQKPQ